MSILVVSEHNNFELNPLTLNTVFAATKIAPDIDLLVAGYNCLAVCQQARKINGVAKILHVDDEIYQHHLAENLSQLVSKIINERNYSHVLSSNSTFAKNFLPRTAALLDVEQISDVSRIISADTFVRPIYAGNALETVQSSDSVKLLTIRAIAFKAITVGENNAQIVSLAKAGKFCQTEFINLIGNPFEVQDLSQAKIIVAGGKGLGSKENFKIIERLAFKLKAAVGATRAAVDAGFVSNEHQIGQTGKVVAPDLYIAVGISGAIQHLAGMKESKIIVALNKDQNAPIVQVADFSLIGDLFTTIPKLESLLEN